MGKSSFLLSVLLVLICFTFPGNSSANFFTNLADHIENKINHEVETRSNRKADKAVDKTLDNVENGADDAVTGKSASEPGQTPAAEPQQQQQQQSQQQQAATKKPVVKWSKFDFVPGDEIIFADGPSIDEENGEFPSRWDYSKGSAEIGEMDGTPVIMFMDGGAEIIPYLKNSKEDYLPKVFTLEFDVWFEPGSHFHRYWISFHDLKNQRGKGLNDRLMVYVNGLEFLDTNKRYPGTEKYNWSENPAGGWKHISIAYTRGKFKAYMDDTRLINIPHLEGEPWGVTVEAENGNMFMKNVRLAKGGVKYYDRFLTDGKIIINGIRFDVNKAEIKPESNGAINKIFKLMRKHPEVKFSVEGHTDNSGNDKQNMKLSQARAEAIVERLVRLGIARDRLQFKGWGETKPLASNATAEGRANNRRVEFVKI